MLAFLDNTNEALSGILRTGRAGSNTAADHVAVLGQALAQLPEHARAGRILVRTDGDMVCANGTEVAGTRRTWRHPAGR